MLCLPILVNAQSYLGYLGKKQIISISALSGLSTFSQYGRNYSQRYLRPTISFQLGYEYCYKKSLSFGGALQVMGTNYNSNTVGSPIADGVVPVFPRYDYLGTCKSRMIGITAFVRKYITSVGGNAPNGVYLEHGLNFNTLHIKDFNMDSLSQSNVPVKVSEPQKLQYVSYSFFIGKHFISHHKQPLYFDIALGLNFTTNFYGKMNADFFDPDEPFTANYPEFGSVLKCYYANLNYSNVRFGVGYLF